MKFAPKKAYKK